MKKDWKERYGPWAVVTGASSGIGRAIALELGRCGLNLVLVARRESQLKALASELPTDTRIVLANLASTVGIEKVLASTEDLDVGLLVASAGFGTSGPFVSNAVETELEMVSVNCRAVTWMSHVYSARMLEAGRTGGLILMSSIVAFQGVARAANYAATKAYIQTFAEGLHRELAPGGIDVIASAPGPVQTEFGSRADMIMNTAAEPSRVAASTLNALGRKVTIRPGFLAKFLGYSLSILPRGLRVLVMGLIMGGMTRHQLSS